jgi:hypothetical protein
MRCLTGTGLTGLLLLGCATGSPRFVAQTDLVRGYSEEAQREEPFEAPYVSKFSKSGKSIVVAAVRHSVTVSSGSHKTVEKLFSEFKPDLVVVEGYETSIPLDEKFYKRDQPDCSDRKKFTCDPSPYAFVSAYEKRIQVVGGEPSDAEILRAVVNGGFTAEDLIGFYVSRQIPQWNRQHSLREEGFENRVTRFAHYYLEKMNSSDSFKFVDYLA